MGLGSSHNYDLPESVDCEEQSRRHCAFCLIPIAGEEVKICGKCRKRAYCSRGCQSKDWKSRKGAPPSLTGRGQGHKDWCGLPAGEEDLDWYIKDGGKGVVAKRFIRQGERIAVVGDGDFKAPGAKYRRIDQELYNHSCDANAQRYASKDFNVYIVSAEMDIEEGSEITMNYINFNASWMPQITAFDDGSKVPINCFEDGRKELRSRYGIVCPKDCFCYNKEIEKMIIKGKKVYGMLYKIDQISMGLMDARTVDTKGIDWNIDIAANYQQLIAGLDKVHGGRVMKGYYRASFHAIACSALGTPRFAQLSQKYNEYRAEALEIFRSIFHPDSKYSQLLIWQTGIE